MSYVPRLRYVFYVANVRVMELLTPVIRYLDACGQTPRVLAGHPQVCKALHSQGVHFHLLKDLPQDYDVMLSCGMGYTPFERYWLEKSMAAQKINLVTEFASMPADFEQLFFVPRRMKFIHGLCTWDRQTIPKIQRYNKEVFFLPTGSCTWDRYRTADFRQSVSQVRAHYGDKLLVVGLSGLDPAKEIPYYQMICAGAKSLGFNVILQIHPGKSHLFEGVLDEYKNSGIDRHVLFAAASHVITFIFSMMTIECLYLGTKVACKPLAAHYRKWRNCPMLDVPEWRQWANAVYDPAFLELLPLVHDEASLCSFLTSGRPQKSRAEIADLFGWPQADSYCAEKFRVIESCLGPGREAVREKMLLKNELSRGLQIDFSFADVLEPASVGRSQTCPADFLQAGLSYLRQGDPGRAMYHLNRANMFSGAEHFDVIQYLRAVGFLQQQKTEDASECIYQALYVNPGKAEYLQLHQQIEDIKAAPAAVV